MGRAGNSCILLNHLKENTLSSSSADHATDAENTPGVISQGVVFDEFRRMTEAGGMTRREAVAALARQFATPAREIYRLIELAKNESL